MAQTAQVHIIAHIRSDFSTKFGIPRQSGLVEELEAAVVFEPEYRNEAALRGLEGFSHLWLIWEFSQAKRESWSPTVRPPRLGGNRRLGVFATRSPFRPNPIGLSCVRLLGVDLHTPDGPVIRVAGADLMDGTPIYDVKPYLPYADCKPEALGGFAAQPKQASLTVDFPEELLALVPERKRQALRGVLAQDPRPSYQEDPQRVYGMTFGGLEVKFRVEGDRLTVCQVEPAPER
ncbi:tRNA (N6-threonylcarbamoyladenosine(37)-N6)-methyltransferase TrmO [Pseudoflavonifractor phocaeensis]|uniref:tRNA (N6-threonylcarbamoyladenosine(37)-N6)-methyltransferase TrmO n=1 Tax=Pseudoflavonifractor phocaeensis TaxID=1870988 RepID=UPI001EFF8B4D|nr:tRNA (N6-threonylcarbamoyladenosine(37)-N6)-methyltransferase TrmO [Pseudoflavonifractor phocaeensis]MCF2597092.1 tRNA (N6-threonylcarbamoyladenosine(37)-N6)-methyltransferase TrmO [Pseudoflavonifractor phocaeensis]